MTLSATVTHLGEPKLPSDIGGLDYNILPFGINRAGDVVSQVQYGPATRYVCYYRAANSSWAVFQLGGADLSACIKGINDDGHILITYKLSNGHAMVIDGKTGAQTAYAPPQAPTNRAQYLTNRFVYAAYAGSRLPFVAFYANPSSVHILKTPPGYFGITNIVAVSDNDEWKGVDVQRSLTSTTSGVLMSSREVIEFSGRVMSVNNSGEALIFGDHPGTFIVYKNGQQQTISLNSSVGFPTHITAPWYINNHNIICGSFRLKTGFSGLAAVIDGHFYNLMELEALKDLKMLAARGLNDNNVLCCTGLGVSEGYIRGYKIALSF